MCGYFCDVRFQCFFDFVGLFCRLVFNLFNVFFGFFKFLFYGYYLLRKGEIDIKLFFCLNRKWMIVQLKIFMSLVSVYKLLIGIEFLYEVIVNIVWIYLC